MADEDGGLPSTRGRATLCWEPLGVVSCRACCDREGWGGKGPSEVMLAPTRCSLDSGREEGLRWGRGDVESDVVGRAVVGKGMAPPLLLGRGGNIKKVMAINQSRPTVSLAKRKKRKASSSEHKPRKMTMMFG